MQKNYRLFFFPFFILLASPVFSQKIKDTIIGSKDTLNIFLPLNTNKSGKINLMMAPDQIGFGQLRIDTIEKPYTIKQRIIDSAYRSVSLYMALHKKEFKAWERENYPITKSFHINWNLGTPPSRGINLWDIFRLFFGKNFGCDKWQISADDRLKLEGEWSHKQRIERDKKLQGKYEEDENQHKDNPSFTVSLQDMINDLIFSKDYVRF